VGPRTGLDDVERRKILPVLGLELPPLSRPAHSQLPYRLSYPGSLTFDHVIFFYVKHDGECMKSVFTVWFVGINLSIIGARCVNYGTEIDHTRTYTSYIKYSSNNNNNNNNNTQLQAVTF
jgi:hypothetical protein